MSLGRADIARVSQRYKDVRIELADVMVAGAGTARVDATVGSRSQLRSSFL